MVAAILQVTKGFLVVKTLQKLRENNLKPKHTKIMIPGVRTTSPAGQVEGGRKDFSENFVPWSYQHIKSVRNTDDALKQNIHFVGEFLMREDNNHY